MVNVPGRQTNLQEIDLGLRGLLNMLVDESKLTYLVGICL